MKIIQQTVRAVFAAAFFWVCVMASIAAVELVYQFFRWPHTALDMQTQAWVWLWVALPIGVISFLHQRQIARRVAS